MEKEIQGKIESLIGNYGWILITFSIIIPVPIIIYPYNHPMDLNPT